ncbi:MAG: DNA repair protein RecN [Burkholderiales bacterium]|nr:DNA repair protein RecN [Burkholderiales bacterium]
MEYDALDSLDPIEMLTSLNIRNFVLVEKLELDFKRGFTALTGETGAGKSILIDALQLLFGARSDIEFVRQGCEKSDLSASFTVSPEIRKWLQDNDVDNEEPELLLRRTLDTHGRSKAWINGYPVPLSQLKDLSSLLVVVHGQHAHQSLIRKGAQMEILDSYAKLGSEVSEVRKIWKELSDAREKLRKAKEESALNQEKLKQLQWLLEDLNDLNPKKGEWEKINEEHTRMSRWSEILESCGKVRQLLTEDDVSAVGIIDSAISNLENVSDVDPKLEALLNNLNDAREIAVSVSDGAEHYLSKLDFDEEGFATLDERIGEYLRVANRHRLEPEELFGKLQEVRQEAENLKELGDLTILEERLKEVQGRYDQAAQTLSDGRKKGAQTMQKLITKAMQSLALEGGSFEIKIDETEHPTSTGKDSCEFLVAGHAGASRRPLSKVASGGELARISLAVAVTDTATAAVDTLIFDEVDTGVGGAVAETVGRLLAEVGKNQQVLCVTHLAQVASCANNQMKIVKSAGKDSAPVSSVTPLNDEERVAEIARMLGGIKLTEKTMEHAREMLSRT